jgi:hypothetical protein
MLESKYQKLQDIIIELRKIAVGYSGGLARCFPMLRAYLRKNFYWCIFWGIILQIAGSLLRPVNNYRQEFTILTTFMTTLGYLFLLSGTAFLLLGFYFYVKSKHRHSIWCLFALLPIIGWIVLVLLKDKDPLPLSKENS